MPAVTKSASTDALTAHVWSPQPEAARLVGELVGGLCERNPWLAALSRRMFAETGTRLLDWIDSLGVPAEDPVSNRLDAAGFERADMDSCVVWSHAAGLFPRIRIHEGADRRLALKVESVADFLLAQGLVGVQIEGPVQGALRTALVSRESGVEVLAVERHGTLTLDPNPGEVPPHAALLDHQEALRLRRRDFNTDEEGFQHARRLVDAAIRDLGRDRTCDLFFAAERDYWLARNAAGRVQKARQDRLGLGWANHDHHTYRSSRACFVQLIAFLERLGFQCRERFYAGRDAGWGAQVIEHPITGVTIFADVDLSPEEVSQDFSHEPLPERPTLGTVGLWCALHGEAFLQAGLHHLECQFDYEATRQQLHAAGIESMPPFTDLPYLRQAFTRGEVWAVDPRRVDRLRAQGRISANQARQFLERGALGSHLEILQRDDGYKGFNQRGISEIITATDPRSAV